MQLYVIANKKRKEKYEKALVLLKKHHPLLQPLLTGWKRTVCSFIGLGDLIHAHESTLQEITELGIFHDSYYYPLDETRGPHTIKALIERYENKKVA